MCNKHENPISWKWQATFAQTEERTSVLEETSTELFVSSVEWLCHCAPRSQLLVGRLQTGSLTQMVTMTMERWIVRLHYRNQTPPIQPKRNNGNGIQKSTAQNSPVWILISTSTLIHYQKKSSSIMNYNSTDNQWLAFGLNASFKRKLCGTTKPKTAHRLPWRR